MLRSSRPFMAALGVDVKRFLLIAMALTVMSCAVFSVSNRQISNAEIKWKNSSLASYSFTLAVGRLAESIECESSRMGIEVKVKDGALVQFGTCDTGVVFAKEYGSIDSIFESLRREKKEGAVSIEVRFNERYGYPEYIDINYSRLFSDHRVQYHITNFKLINR